MISYRQQVTVGPTGDSPVLAEDPEDESVQSVCCRRSNRCDHILLKVPELHKMQL